MKIIQKIHAFPICSDSPLSLCPYLKWNVLLYVECVCERESCGCGRENASRSMPWDQENRTAEGAANAKPLRDKYAKYAASGAHTTKLCRENRAQHASEPNATHAKASSKYHPFPVYNIPLHICH